MTGDATPPAPWPPGEAVATGRACPQTGWWECVELAAPVEGGRRQHFVFGERMPAAVLLGEAGVWRRLRGEPRQRHSIATVWKLVAADAPTLAASAPPS